MEDTQIHRSALTGRPESLPVADDEGGSDAPPGAHFRRHGSNVLAAGAAPLPRTASVSGKETRILRGWVPVPRRSMAIGLTWVVALRTTPTLPRKEVIQPQLPLRLPCYDFVPITRPTLDRCPSCELAHGLQVLPAFVT
jgi:hypothetical protein